MKNICKQSKTQRLTERKHNMRLKSRVCLKISHKTLKCNTDNTIKTVQNM